MTTRTANHSRRSMLSASHGRNTLQGAASQFGVRVRHAVDNGRARVTAWKGNVEHGIREKPIQSVLVAAAVGAVIGLIVGRRGR